MMQILDLYTLLSGAPCSFGDLCTIRQPTLGDIRDTGFSQYQEFLSAMLLTKSKLLELLEIEDAKGLDEFTVYDIIFMIPDLQSLFIRALSFFVNETIRFTDGKLFIDEKLVCSSDLDQIRSIILQLSYVPSDSVEHHTFASEKARRIWEKCHRGKESLRKAKKEDVNMELPNLIGAVAAYHGGYSLLNIWNLTVYQLYDQFARMNIGVQLDIYGARWAAWGKDDFDTAMWFKNISNKGDEMQ